MHFHAVRSLLYTPYTSSAGLLHYTVAKPEPEPETWVWGRPNPKPGFRNVVRVRKFGIPSAYVWKVHCAVVRTLFQIWRWGCELLVLLRSTNMQRNWYTDKWPHRITAVIKLSVRFTQAGLSRVAFKMIRCVFLGLTSLLCPVTESKLWTSVWPFNLEI